MVRRLPSLPSDSRELFGDASTSLLTGLMSASHRSTVGIDATRTIAELANIHERECAIGQNGSFASPIAGSRPRPTCRSVRADRRL
jgi:hypothetical protein